MAPLLDCLRQNSLLLEQTAYSGILLDPFISTRYEGSSHCCCTVNRFSYIRATQALLDPTWENLPVLQCHVHMTSCCCISAHSVVQGVLSVIGELSSGLHRLERSY